MKVEVKFEKRQKEKFPINGTLVLVSSKNESSMTTEEIWYSIIGHLDNYYLMDLSTFTINGRDHHFTYYGLEVNEDELQLILKDVDIEPIAIIPSSQVKVTFEYTDARHSYIPF